jgi:hypothetical protein
MGIEGLVSVIGSLSEAGAPVDAQQNAERRHSSRG